MNVIPLMLVSIIAAGVFAIASGWPVAHLLWVCPVAGSLAALIVACLNVTLSR